MLWKSINVCITVLSAVAAVNEAVESGAEYVTWQALQNPDAHLTALDESNLTQYHDRLLSDKIAKEEVSCG